MSVKSKFSSSLYRARCERRMTQSQAAEKLNISLRWYQKIEKGESEPNLQLACNIAKYFSIDLSEFAEEFVS